MSERTAYFEVADQDGYIFSNCKYEDLIVYTDTSNQAIHFGNTMSNNSAFMIRNNDVNILRNMSIGKSNPYYPLDVLGNAAIDGSLTSTKHVVSRGLQVKKRSTPYFTDTTLPSGIVVGFSNDTFGLNLSISSNNANNYIRFITLSNENRTELVRLTGTGNLGIGTSNPTSKLHVVGNSYIQGNISTGHIFPLSNEFYDLGTSNMRFKDLYLSSNTIYLGDGKIKKTAQGIVIMDSNDKTSGSIASMMMLSNNGFIELHTKCNNLGIGTQNPSEKLEVNGSARISSNVYIVQRLSVGTSNPKESLDIVGNILASQNIYSLGNVGIGTSNPTNKLEVNGSARISSNLEVANNLTVQGNLTITGSNFTVNTQTVEVRDNIIVLNSGQVGSGVSAGTAGITIDRGDAVDYQLLFNETTDKFEMGAVGSLIPIASEAYVNARNYDASNITSGTLPVARGGTGTTTSTGTGSNVLSISPNITGTMTVVNITASGSISGPGAGISNINATNISSGTLPVARGGTGTTTSTGSGNIVLSSNPTFQGTVTLPDTEVNGTMISTGNVGIRNTNPLCPLVVQCTSNTGCLKLVNSTSSAGDQWWMGFCHNVDSANTNDRARIGVDIMSGGAGRLYFTTGSAGGQSEKMRINEDGYVGIGLSNPTTTLEINGGIKVRSNVEILGDLTIRGTTTTVDSTTVNIVDNIIRLNNGAAFSSALQAGFEVNRGAGYSNYLVVFDEASDTLQTGFQGSLKVVPNIDSSLISNGVLLYDNTNKKITSCNNFIYSGIGLGIGTTTPTEQLDINKNIKVNSNLYVLSRLGIATSNPSTSVEINATDAILIPKGTTVQRPSVPSQGQIRYNTSINTFEGYGAGNAWGSLGGIKDTNQDTYISAESFPTSNDDILRFFNSNNETLRITATGRIGISNQSPSERLEVSGGNAKFSSNVYVIGKIGIGSGSNPKESLDITGNILVSQDIYTLGNLGVGTSNPSSRLEVIGSAKISSNLEVSSNITANRSIVHCTNPAFPTIIRADKDMMTAFGTNSPYVGDNGDNGGQAHLILSGISDYNKRLAFMYNTTDNFGAIQSMIYGVGGTPLILNLGGGNVGIGTSNPSSRLEVIGSAKISSNLEVTKDLIVNGNLIVSGSNISSGSSSGGGGSSSLISTSSNIVPTVNGTLDLGSPEKRWRNLYLSGNLISFGNGMNIDGYAWSYLANYVVPPRVVANTVSTYLFTGAAQDHSAYVRNGELFVCGRNDYGQLGLGHTSNVQVPTKVPGIANAALVACGERFTVCVKTDGTAVSAGLNANGQLGNGTVVTNSNFVGVAGVSNAIAVAAGYTHTLFMTSNGTVVGCGSDANGQLGRGASSANVVINSNIVPMLMPTPQNGEASSTFRARSIAAGGYHTCVLLENGSAYLCGKNDQGQCGASPTLVPQANGLGIVPSLSNVVDVACGHEHTLFVRYDGQVLGFGRNDKGQLGQGTKNSPVTSVVQVLAGGGSNTGLSTEVAAGFNHSAFIKPDNTIWVVGANDKGQLGLGQSTTEALTLTQIVGYAGYDIACGRNHTVISTTPDPLTFNYSGNNALIAFGDNTYGQIGDNNPNTLTRWFPNRIHDGTFQKKLGQGYGAYNGHYIDTDGVLYVTGYNYYGILGDESGTGTHKSTYRPVSRLMSTGRRIISVRQFSSYIVAIDSTGSVFTWGGNGSSPNLGNGTSRVSRVPINISEISGSSLIGKYIVAIGGGSYHSFLIDSTGKVHAWGRNPYGQIGNNTINDVSTPINISNISQSSLINKTIIAIVGGESHTIALDSTGKVHAWGRNQFGQLGSASNSDLLLPTDVSNANGSSINNRQIVAISCGENFSVALDSIGHIHTWGDNSNYQLGYNNTVYANRNIAVNISTTYTAHSFYNRKIVAISCSISTTLALDSTGEVHVWGTSSYGQMGRNNNAAAMYAVNISNVTNSSINGKTIVAVSSLGYHCMAIDSDGGMHVWGYNAQGHLGNNDTTQMDIPILINKTARDYHSHVLSTGLGNHKLLSNISATTSTLKAVGSNTNRQVGDNTTTDRYSPVDLPTFASAIVGTADSVSHSAVVLQNGDVWCWGANGSGQCGTNTSGTALGVPTKVVGITNAIEVACGDGFTLVRNADNTVMAFGLNTSGQLGVGSSVVATSTHIPTLVSTLSGSSGSKMIAAGTAHAASVDGTGTLRVWGAGTYGKLGLGSTSNVFTPTIIDVSVFDFNKVTHVSLGENHTVVICSGATGGGKVYTAGLNDSGQLGRSNGFETSTNISTFGLVTLPTPATPLYAACGSKHTVLHVASDRIVTFGERINGQTIVSRDAAWVPQLVEVIGEGEAVYDVRAVVASPIGTHIEMPPVNEGYTYNGRPARILTMGTWKRWGLRVKIGTLHGYYSLFVTSSGNVTTAGINTNGQTGNETTNTTPSGPTNISSVRSLNGKVIVAVAGGTAHCVALDSTGHVHTWGGNTVGQLGNNTYDPYNYPVNISIISGGSLMNKTIVEIASGQAHVLALDSTGQLHAWGNNYYYTVGNSSGGNVVTPINISTYSSSSSIFNKKIVAVACGYNNSYALDSTGRVHAWGYNMYGQIGKNSYGLGESVPIDISDVSQSSLLNKKIVAICGGEDFTIALDSTGRVHAWGKNNFGQLGNGTFDTSYLPLDISSITNSSLNGRTIVAIASAGLHCLAIDTLGCVHSWGCNAKGALGRGTLDDTGFHTPMDITNISQSSLNNVNVVAIACGGNGIYGSSYAIDSTGRLHMWGYNTYYQLANGSNIDVTKPIAYNSIEPVQNLFVNFTGQHRCFVDALAPSRLREHEGLVVVTDKNKYVSGLLRGNRRAMGINQALPLVSLSRTPKDPRAFGVISMTQDHPAGPTASLTETQLQKIQEQGDVRVQINSIGEGCIWVCDENGSLKAGDYVTTSSIPGYAMRQLSSDNTPDSVLRNYTVAKLTMDCDFTQPMVEVEEVQKDEYGNVVIDEFGAPVYIKVMTTLNSNSTSDPQTPQTEPTPQTESVLVPATEPAYQMRWLSYDAESSTITQITKEQYEERKTAGDTNVIRAAFLGCTYHCG